MKKTFILIIIASLCFPLFIAQLPAFESGSPEIQGDDRYEGKFVGFRNNMIQIDLKRTGYRVSLPLADDVEFLHKDMGYVRYEPAKIFSEAPVKAIEVDGKIVQVILLWLMPR